MKDKEYYYKLFLKSLKKTRRHKGYSEYGSRVMPILNEYKKIDNFEDRKAFQDALEMLLRDNSDENKNFGVDICLGFFIFRDSI